MRFTLLSVAFAVLLCIHAAMGASTRSSKDAFTRSNIKSLSLRAWGPLEKDASGDAIILDPTTTSESQIDDLKSKGKAVICYMSAGTLENYRKDKSEFSDSKAKKYKGFGGSETWLDVTKWQELKGPMADRIALAASKGCMGMEVGQSQICSPSPCDITYVLVAGGYMVALSHVLRFRGLLRVIKQTDTGTQVQRSMHNRSRGL